MIESRAKEKFKTTLVINDFNGLNQYLDVNQMPVGVFKEVINLYNDDRLILRARPGTTAKETIEKTYDDNIPLYRIQHLSGIDNIGECVVAEWKQYPLDNNPQTRALYYTKTPFINDSWKLLVASIDYEGEVYPYRMAVYKGQLWITNGMYPVKIWNGISVKNLSNPDSLRPGKDSFMKGKSILVFMNRIWFANTPESPYNLICNKFTDDNGKWVGADSMEAWDASMINSFPEMIYIYGMRQLTPQSMMLFTKGGIFVIQFMENGEPSDLRKVSDICCVDGEYYNTDIPLAFSVEKRGYFYDGIKFSELKPICDSLADNVVNPFPLDKQLLIRTSEEFKENGTFHRTTVDWKKDVLTLGVCSSPLYGEESDSVEIGDCQQIGTTFTSGQSFTVEAWGSENLNIGKAVSDIAVQMFNDTNDHSDASDVDVELIIAKYDSPPVLFGKQVHKIIARKTATAKWGYREVTFSFIGLPELVVLEPGEVYYISVRRIGGAIDQISWVFWSDIYSGGMAWRPDRFHDETTAGMASPNFDFSFRILYFSSSLTQRNEPEDTCPQYISKVYFDNDVTNLFQGRMISVSYLLPGKLIAENNNTDYELACYLQVRGQDTPFLPDATTPVWAGVATANAMAETLHAGCMTARLGMNERFGKYFQFRIIFRREEGYQPLSCQTPEVYSIQIHTQQQEGQIIARQTTDMAFLLLKGTKFSFTQKGWYKWSNLPLTDIVEYDKTRWGVVGDDKQWTGTEHKYYYLEFSDTKKVDYTLNPLLDLGIPTTLKTGILDCGLPESDKRFRKIRILMETDIDEPVSLNIQYHTSETSGSIAGEMVMTPTPLAYTQLRLLEIPFPEGVWGKWIVLDNIQASSVQWFRGIKSIELLYEVRRIVGDRI